MQGYLVINLYSEWGGCLTLLAPCRYFPVTLFLLIDLFVLICSGNLGDYAFASKTWWWYSSIACHTNSRGEVHWMGPMEEKSLLKVPQDPALHIALPDCRYVGTDVKYLYFLLE